MTTEDLTALLSAIRENLVEIRECCWSIDCQNPHGPKGDAAECIGCTIADIADSAMRVLFAFGIAHLGSVIDAVTKPPEEKA